MAVTAVTLEDIGIGVSFVLGAIAGTIATIAVMRTLVGYFDKRQER